MAETDDAYVESQVTDYLCEHPDFFKAHESLLGLMALSHPVEGAISLIERQVALLRERNQALETQMHQAVLLAREQERLSTISQKIALSLVEPRSFIEMIRAIEAPLLEHLSVNAFYLHLTRIPSTLFQPPLYPITIESSEGLLGKALRGGCPMITPLSPEIMQSLFPQCAQEVASSLILPLGLGGRMGLAAIGSDNADRFHPQKGRAFFSFLTQVIERTIRLHADL